MACTAAAAVSQCTAPKRRAGIALCRAALRGASAPSRSNSSMRASVLASPGCGAYSRPDSDLKSVRSARSWVRSSRQIAQRSRCWATRPLSRALSRSATYHGSRRAASSVQRLSSGHSFIPVLQAWGRVLQYHPQLAPGVEHAGLNGIDRTIHDLGNLLTGMIHVIGELKPDALLERQWRQPRIE